MPDDVVDQIRDLLGQCTPDQQRKLLAELRLLHPIHEFEKVIGAPAETILGAIHRAQELTVRMLRGVIAEAAFHTFEMPRLETLGWKDVTEVGNFAYDYLLADHVGPVRVQVKLQRSERGAPLIKKGARYGYNSDVFIVETQKTRTGNDAKEGKTRPYRFGEFDILAVSMQPSSGRWDTFMYAPTPRLLAAKDTALLATYQPISQGPSRVWSDDFVVAVNMLRETSMV